MEAFKLTLEVEDFPRARHNLRYSWDNKSSGQERIMARLDRAYVDSLIEKWKVGFHIV